MSRFGRTGTQGGVTMWSHRHVLCIVHPVATLRSAATNIGVDEQLPNLWLVFRGDDGLVPPRQVLRSFCSSDLSSGGSCLLAGCHKPLGGWSVDANISLAIFSHEHCNP